MEELSIEEKAKRYDDVIRKAKITLDCCTSDSTITEHVVYDIFPELKESEDERVRELCKVLVRTCFMNELCTKEDKDECMVWIEKQGKNNTGISEATMQKLEDNLNKALEKETPESWNEFLEKQPEQKSSDIVKPKFKVGDQVVKCNGGEL